MNTFQVHVAATMLEELDKLDDQHSIDAQKLRLALSGLGSDPLPSRVTKLIRRGHYYILKAFWECHITAVELPVTESRLVVNPPPGLKVPSLNVLTFQTQEFLEGQYGAVAKEPSHIRLYRAANLTTTYFEDLTIFWGKGVSEPRHLIDALVPGSTITLVQPSDAHKPWMAYYDMTHGCDAIMEEVVDRFNVSSVWKNRDPNVAVEIIGIESPK